MPTEQESTLEGMDLTQWAGRDKVNVGITSSYILIRSPNLDHVVGRIDLWRYRLYCIIGPKTKKEHGYKEDSN